jgi:hypothetical protein
MEKSLSNLTLDPGEQCASMERGERNMYMSVINREIEMAEPGETIGIFTSTVNLSFKKEGVRQQWWLGQKRPTPRQKVPVSRCYGCKTSGRI